MFMRTLILLTLCVVANATAKISTVALTMDTDAVPGTALTATAGALITVKLVNPPAGNGVEFEVPGNFPTNIASDKVALLFKGAEAPATGDTGSATTAIPGASNQLVGSANSLKVRIAPGTDNGNNWQANNYVGIYVKAGTLDEQTCSGKIKVTYYTVSGNVLATDATDKVEKQPTDTELVGCKQCGDAEVATAPTTKTKITAQCFCGNRTTIATSTETNKKHILCAINKVCTVTRETAAEEKVGDTFKCADPAADSTTAGSSNALTVGVSAASTLFLVSLIKMF